MGWFRWKLDTLGGVGTCLGWVLIEACLKMSKNDPLSMFTHMWTRACIQGLHSCVRGWDLCVCGPIHAYTYLFLSSCVCGFQPAYACLVSMYADTSLRAYVTSQEPYFNSYFICFLSKCKYNTLFSSFCRLCPHFKVKEALTMGLHIIGSWL